MSRPFVPGSISNRCLARCLHHALQKAELDIAKIAQTSMPEGVLQRAATRIEALKEELEIFQALAKDREARTQRRLIVVFSWGLKHLLVREQTEDRSSSGPLTH